MYVVLIVLTLFSLSNAQLPRWGACPNVPVQENFNVNSYMGTWFELKKSFAAFELGLKCNTANYIQTGDTTVSVVNSGIKRWIFSRGERTQVNGTARIPDPNVPAKLLVSFSEYSEGPYWVLDTDYNNYSLVYSCVNLVNSKWLKLSTENIWILTRYRGQIEEVTEQRLKRFLDANDISSKRLTDSIQTGC